MTRLSLWEPSRDLFSFGSDLDRFFDWSGERERTYVPAVEHRETDSHHVLSFDVPGLGKDAINIEVLDDVLTISGERKFEENDKSRRHSERFYGKFTRSFALPKGIDASQIEANYQDGVLLVAVPKPEEKKPHKIEVKKESGGFLKKLVGNTSNKLAS